MYIINTLAPIVLLVMLGMLLRSFHFAERSFFSEINRLVYWVGLPALLFSETAGARLALSSALRIFLVLFAGAVACIALGYAVGRLLRVPGDSMGAFVQGAYRGNLAYVGLPVVLYALAAAEGPSREIAGLAVLAIAPLIPLYNIAAVILLTKGDKEAQTPGEADIWRNIAKNPLIIACLAGLAFQCTGLNMPLFLQRSLKGTGQMAMPLSLIGIGASLNLQALGKQVSHICAASVIKVAAAPLAGLLLGWHLQLSPAELLAAMLLLACPTAVASFIMAEQMDGDHQLSGGIVVMSTILAMPAMAVILYTMR